MRDELYSSLEIIIPKIFYWKLIDKYLGKYRKIKKELLLKKRVLINKRLVALGNKGTKCFSLRIKVYF